MNCRKGSVVNDLHLWINGRVMRALILNTWTARKIYDSIVAMKRDPAFLAKKGDQYELHIYPMVSGSLRKIKLNFITPTQWLGTQASAELPYRFLNANSSLKKPVDILFRNKVNAWGIPSIAEFPDRMFSTLKDTMNYHYKLLSLPDISNKSNMSLLFSTEFESGYYYSINENKKDYTYYQLGILPEKFFDIKPVTVPKNFMIGVDLSGKSNNDISKININLRKTLKSALKSTDKFNIILSGAGIVEKINPFEVWGTPENIDALCDRVLLNRVNDSIKAMRKLNLLFCDEHAYSGWDFPTIEKYANVTRMTNLREASDQFNNYDVAAGYKHGYESLFNYCCLSIY